ncbi:ADP-ribosylglycohydrolase family protein [Lignipirellula cremea]|uniref:ADP-ribosylglycohydrolase n=1 Tax=Lignipirellula cremea TaxID=2528010 RepID=A0A518E088_9BACT|nr:ADP-ribosylglycohydrolase family protein [Lignipirellula cremea]QDU97489.1 ADP-ribosylglycohydrolase [Lignipirellula cremea]
MWGAIIGDIVGSVYEGRRDWMPVRRVDFQPLVAEDARFTDDTVLTIAVADSLLYDHDLIERLKAYTVAYPLAGYGKAYREWAFSEREEPYNSYGNGSAMRVSPVGWRYSTLDQVLLHARRTAMVTHNHPEGVKGAQAIAAGVFLARTGMDRPQIAAYLTQEFGYELERSIDDQRAEYVFDSSCQGTVPQAIRAFLEADDFEHALRLAISLGGDADTLACMAGALAEAFFGTPPAELRGAARRLLDPSLRVLCDAFTERYGRGT